MRHLPFFFFNHPATTEIYTLSLHDALPIYAKTMLVPGAGLALPPLFNEPRRRDRKSTRLNSSHVSISYAVFCSKKKIPKLAYSIVFISVHAGRVFPFHLDFTPGRR